MDYISALAKLMACITDTNTILSLRLLNFGPFYLVKLKAILLMKTSLTSQSILGILGSGQLARMSALAASELGISTHIYCNDSEQSPAEQVSAFTIKGSFNDIDRIIDFCNGCDIITLENEFIDQNILEEIEKKFLNKLYPSAKTFKLIGDKISEKNNFTKAGLRVAPYKAVTSAKEVLDFSAEFGFPVVLKSAKGGYDGHGNITLKNENDVREKFHLLKGELLVEAFIPYEKELAIISARNSSGDIIFYPVAHTIQENHICHFVSVPAAIDKKLEEEIRECAHKAMIAIDAVGVFAFEFFLTKDNDLYLNESAPRPHNSGHYSIEGCSQSQFHNHVRSVFNLPLVNPKLKAQNILMLNLLGTQNEIAKLTPIDHFLSIENGHLHLYGKKFSKKGRKMGHYTLLGDNFDVNMKTLSSLKAEYSL
jgi:5-(carboxyamino)imidazole ribonucleotide synthase